MKEQKRSLVSVLMTAYNREKYIAEAIESVIASTYQDWELIIVDDCSKDRTVEIAKSYESKDKRIKVYLNEKNLGDYPNRNKAASYAKGKYLKYLDADDLIYPQGLYVMVMAMERFPEAGLGTQINIREYFKPYPVLLSSNEVFQKHFIAGGLLFSGPTGTIIRRDTFEKVGGFSGKRYLGDTELWFKLSSITPTVIFQSSLIWWRVHPDQEITREKTNFQVVIDRFNLNIDTLQNKSCPLSNEERKKAILNQKKNFGRKILLHLFIKPSVAFSLFKSKYFEVVDILKVFHSTKLSEIIQKLISKSQPFAKFLILKTSRVIGGHPTKTFLSGKGMILALHRVVKEERISRFNEILEIAENKLDFVIRHLKRNNYDFISLDDLPERLKSESKRKFAVITFDDGYKDNYTLAYPILKKYSIPFTLYLTTSFPDGKVVLWWYLLEEVIKNNIEISFSYDGRQYIYALVEKADKERAFDSLRRFIIDSTPYAMQSKIESVLSPYIPDLYAKTKELALSWEEVKFLSQDPLVTIGNHTVNHYAMTTLSNEDILKEILTAQEIIKDKTGITTKHFAYPFGSRREVNRESLEIVKSMGYITGTTTLPGNLFNEYLYKDKLFLLPRYLMCEKASKYTLNIRMNGIYPFLVNNYSLRPKL